MGRPKGSKNKSQGLGDTIEKVTKATGIDKVVKKVFPDCGCVERKEWLNQKYPYVNKEPKCMNEEQITFYANFKEKFFTGKSSVIIPNEDLQDLISLYNSIFQVNVKGCLGCDASNYIKRLDNVYKKAVSGKE